MIPKRLCNIPPEKRRLTGFASVWILGLVSGGVLFSQADNSYLLLMRSAAQTPVSIIPLLATAFLPFLAVYFSVSISKPWLIYPICFFKACFYSLGGLAVSAAFGSGGWLVRLLLQFTDSGAVCLLCWYALRHLSGGQKTLRRDSLICTAGILVLGWMDTACISPFLVNLAD